MPVFIIFIVIMVIIWGIIASSAAANKQKEMERRRRLQAELQQMAMQQAARNAGVVPPPQPTRRISPGIAQRFPDVLLPPAPQQWQQQQPMSRTAPPAMRRQIQPQPKRPAQRRVAAPPLAQSQPSKPRQAPAPSSATDPIVTLTPERTVTGVNAAAIRRWAKPNVLRQQFILTEIFQPPLALRDTSDR